MVRIRRLLNRWERERGSLTTPPTPRCDSVAAALEQALATLRAGDRLVVCGSFHTVGPALEWLDERGGELGETA